MIYLRNAHPKQTIYLPVRPGWYRVLKPAVATSLPAAVLNTPAVRQLLLCRLLDVVDGAAWDADARQRHAARTDWARAIAAAEQREFDRLTVPLHLQPKRPSRAKRSARCTGPRRRRADEWSTEEIERLKARWAAGVSLDRLAVAWAIPRRE